ncbi:MAG: alpha-1,2-fucosyltransferase [Desulfuromonadales bacterium]|nr:alpha-1,2-fucosyltransferase [Desulfuromonadales bacterium]
MKTSRFGYPILMKAGLGNMLVPWAKCHLWCKDNNARMIAPFWTKFRIGPYLRREKDKRNYQRLFKSNRDIGGLQRLYLLATTTKCAFELFDDTSSPRNRGITVLFSGMDSFDRLIGRHEEIRQALTAMTKPEFVPAKMDKPFIGVHVRLGDYASVENGASAPWTSRLPIDWYVAAVHEVRKTAGFDLDVILFSDGNDEELRALLELPAVRRSEYKESITDILALSQATVIIGSCSSFSMWGAYLAQTFTVWHLGRCPGKIMEQQRSECYETEWLPGNSFPDSFRSGLVKVISA